MKQKEFASNVYKALLEKWPDAHCELNFNNAFELLIATTLSAQTTDVIVNRVTPVLFNSYPTAIDLAKAIPEDVEQIIKSTGFYKNKAKNIINASKDIVENHNGDVPKQMDELISLSGVGRKTANVVLGNAFDINLGVVVDTHVKRCSKLIGLSESDKPLKIEKDLMALYDASKWTMISHLLIFLGRQICIAKKPQCLLCPVNEICKSAKVNA